jgi:hypothetical protein
MRRTPVLAAMAALTLLTGPALAGQAPAKPPEASIPFANHGGVDNWRADGDRTVYFQDLHRQWYRATLFAPAFDLPYVEFIGIDPGPSGALDKWGAIYVHGQRYTFQTFEKIEGQPPRRNRHRS